MATPVLLGLLRCVIHYSFSGGVEEATNTLHFRNDPAGPWTQAEVDALDIAFDTFVTATNDRRSASSVVDKITYTDYSAAIPVQYEKPQNSPGTSPGQVMPLECAVVCSIRTAVPGRSARGRIFFPHLTTNELDVVTNLPAVTSLCRNDLSAALAALLVGTSTNNGGVYSRLQNTFRIATQVIVNGDWDTQRRRGRLNLPSSVTAVPPAA